MASRRNEGTMMELLRLLPWWACLLVGAVGMVGLGWGINQVLPGVGSLAWLLGGMFALLCVMVAIQSAAASAHRRRLLARGTSLDQLLALDPYDFERWVGAWYRSHGFAVQEQGQGGADGGVDLFLRKEGRLTLVQCKRYRSRAVGAPVVRELAGLLGHHSAAGAILVTTSRFTQEAQKFARGKPIELIDGPRLQQMLGQTPSPVHAGAPASGLQPVPTAGPQSAEPVMHGGHTGTAVVVEPASALVKAGNAVQRPAPTRSEPCPRCGNGQMVQRHNRRSGQAFLGCSRYPQCRNTATVTS